MLEHPAPLKFPSSENKGNLNAMSLTKSWLESQFAAEPQANLARARREINLAARIIDAMKMICIVL